MNITILLKTLPAIGIAIYALSKGFPNSSRKAPTARQVVDALPSEIRGTVQDVMRDGPHQFALIDTGKSWCWVGARDGAPNIGDQVACRPNRFVKHFENQNLRMVLEEVYFTDRFEPA